MKNSRAAIRSALSLAIIGLSSVSVADGLYIGADIQSTTLSHTIERDTGELTNPSITSFSEETDSALGIHLGYKFHINNDFFVAAELFYTDENSETTNINNMLQTIIGLNSTYGLNIKAGFDITDKFSVYGILGRTTLEFDIDNSYPFAPPMRSGSSDESDLSLGVGFEYVVANHWSIRGEYTRLNDLDFTPLPEVAVPGKINPNELSYETLKLGVSYTF